MSGAEPLVVLGAISSIIAIIDATKKVYEAAKDTKGLPEAFREVAGRLPIVESILGSAKQNIEEKGVNNDSHKGVEDIIKACKEKAEKLQELFNKVVPGEGASRVERYRKAANVPGKGHKVEKLMQGILEDVNLLAGEKGIDSASKAQQEQILKAIRDIAAVAPSVPEQEFQQTGFTNSNYGSGTQYNAQGENVAQGNAQQYNTAGGSMSFVIQNDSRTQNISSPPGQSEIEAKCLKALFLTDPGDDRAELKDRKGSIVEGTCQWIKSDARYKSWLGSQSQLLWLSGGPGKGKTMLSIFLAEELEETAISQSKLFLQYFCDNKENKRNTAVAVLRGLIWQLLKYRPQLFDHILPSFRTQGESLFSFEPLWRIFKSMVCDPTLENTYCVLDGVDECDKVSLELLLRRFAALFAADTAGPSAYHLNLLIVSRDLPDCIPKLLSSFPCISLDSDADTETSQDIELFIKTKVKELSKDENYSEALRAHVERVFRERAQSTFLWIGVVAKELGGKKRTDVEKVLDLFHPGLDEIYARILLQIDSGHRDIAARILRWVAMAIRPLTLSELSLAIEPTVDSLIVTNRDERIRDQISYCGNFLWIKEDQKGQEYEPYVEGSTRGVRVGFIHQSAKDYLLRKRRDSNSELEAFRVKEDVANHEIAKRCLDYLQSGALEVRAPWAPWILRNCEQMDCFPLLSYAVLHWHEHARSLARSADVFDLSHPFWKKKSEIRASWLKVYWNSDYMPYCHGPPESFTKLHLASCFGIFSIVEKLVLRKGWINKIKRLPVLNKVDSQGMTALMWAANRGHEAVVRLLLELGANKQEKALIFATERGHEAIVHLLLEKGADINAKDMLKETALMKAIEHPHEAITQLLLEKKVDIKARNYIGETALMKAAKLGNEAVTQLLLDKGADIHAVIDSGETVLMSAAGEGLEEVVESLLEKGADIKAVNCYKESALIRAVSRGHEPIVQLLLEKKAHIHDQNRNGDTALMIATRYGYKGIVQLLLEKKVHIHVQNKNGETAIMVAAENGHKAITQLLLEQGADIKAQDLIGDTALMKAARGCYTDSGAIVHLLLGNGADINAVNEKGGTALAIAASLGAGDVVRLLLESGANVNAKDKSGRTALLDTVRYTRSSDQGEPIVRLLLKHGADTEAVDEDEETALIIAAFMEKDDVVQLLVESGANVNARDNSGRSALMRAVASMKPKAMVRLLLDNGADTDAVNEEWETALAIAIRRGRKGIVLLLLENGASIHTKDIWGQTALMLAVKSKQPRVPMVRLLLEYGADTKAVNEDGKTALAIAKKKRLEDIVRLLTPD